MRSTYLSYYLLLAGYVRLLSRYDQIGNFISISTAGLLFVPLTRPAQQVLPPFYPVYTVPDPHGHDIDLDNLKTSAAFKFLIKLPNSIGTYHKEKVVTKE